MTLQQNRSNPPFVLTQIRMLRSPEFRKLSPTAQLLWIYLRANYNPLNPECTNRATGRDQVYLSYSELKTVNGFHSSATISKTFKELIDNGWIQVAEKGGLYAGRSAYYFIGPYGKFPLSQKMHGKTVRIGTGRYTPYSRNESKQKNDDREERV